MPERDHVDLELSVAGGHRLVRWYGHPFDAGVGLQRPAECQRPGEGAEDRLRAMDAEARCLAEEEKSGHVVELGIGEDQLVDRRCPGP